ncbi:GNAT family N-acetyltransferase [Collimonas fungivorans]|uniref:Histone acetyltransferase HPA2-like acetyltransferase n=1 Tax=Collimonas fungivorans (strain Ter331) TaxID=1005048 RepID=G0ABF1_COLFT|nr:GNAT family N-acetyltransferase [Collimonas fungivorans]AEK61357.1 Histone acetyltransferase HPA2-like acetyltransferase [Collimonas fungivorans Ter331]
MQALEFRSATTADLPFLIALRHATMSEHLARVNAARDEASQLARVLAQFEHARIVAIGGQDAGLLKAYREQDRWYIAQIQIAPQFQGQGLGRAIIENVLEQAAREQLPTALKVLTGNPARRLYEALGFKEISQEDAEHLMVCWPGQRGK